MVFKPFGLYNEFHTYPLAQAETPADVIQYPFPEPDSPGRYHAARETIDRYSDQYAVVADLETVMFETAWYLVGFEKFLTDLVREAEYISVLLDRILEYHLIIAKRLIELGADIIWAGDDFGTQKGMLMSPELWRRHFKPRIEYLFQKFKQFKPDIKIAWHSCGSILPIIPDFIDIGLDILNPIQPKAAGMGPRALKNLFGDRLSFFGGIDIQHLIPFGTPNEIRQGVWETASILAEGGGYLAGPAHNIQDDTPVENILVFFSACRDFRFNPVSRNA
jgi:uroporphyrinogen decarboxylase